MYTNTDVKGLRQSENTLLQPFFITKITDIFRGNSRKNHARHPGTRPLFTAHIFSR